MGRKTTWIKPKRGQKKLSIGHLRRAIEGLPDTMPVGPAWTSVPSDADPAVSLEEFGIQEFDDGPIFALGVCLVPLEDFEEDEDDDEELGDLDPDD